MDIGETLSNYKTINYLRNNLKGKGYFIDSPNNIIRVNSSNLHHFTHRNPTESSKRLRLLAGCDKDTPTTQLYLNTENQRNDNERKLLSRKFKFPKYCREFPNEKDESSFNRKVETENDFKKSSMFESDRKHMDTGSSKVSVLPKTPDECYNRTAWNSSNSNANLSCCSREIFNERKSGSTEKCVCRKASSGFDNRDQQRREKNYCKEKPSKEYNANGERSGSKQSLCESLWRQQSYSHRSKSPKKYTNQEEEYSRTDIVTGRPIVIKRRSINVEPRQTSNPESYGCKYNEEIIRKNCLDKTSAHDDETDSDGGRDKTYGYSNTRFRTSKILSVDRGPFKKQPSSLSVSTNKSFIQKENRPQISLCTRNVEHPRPKLQKSIQQTHVQNPKEHYCTSCCCVIDIKLNGQKYGEVMIKRNGIQDIYNENRKNYKKRKVPTDSDYEKRQKNCQRLYSSDDSEDECAKLYSSSKVDCYSNRSSNYEYLRERARLFDINENEYASSEDSLKTPRSILQCTRGEGGKFLKRQSSRSFVADKRSLQHNTCGSNTNNQCVKNLLDIIPERELTRCDDSRSIRSCRNNDVLKSIYQTSYGKKCKQNIENINENTTDDDDFCLNNMNELIPIASTYENNFLKSMNRTPFKTINYEKCYPSSPPISTYQSSYGKHSYSHNKIMKPLTMDNCACKSFGKTFKYFDNKNDDQKLQPSQPKPQSQPAPIHGNIMSTHFARNENKSVYKTDFNQKKSSIRPLRSIAQTVKKEKETKDRLRCGGVLSNVSIVQPLGNIKKSISKPYRSQEQTESIPYTRKFNLNKIGAFSPKISMCSIKEKLIG